MKRSLWRAGRIAACFLMLCFLCGNTDLAAQTRPKTDSVAKATKKAPVRKTTAKKKKKHKKQVEIIHHSEDDKQLEKIKAEKNKQKGIK